MGHDVSVRRAAQKGSPQVGKVDETQETDLATP